MEEHLSNDSGVFMFNFRQKILLKNIAVHFKEMGSLLFYQKCNSNQDPYKRLMDAYKVVIEDCLDFPLLADMLRYKISLQKTYSEVLIKAGIFMRLSGGRNLYNFLYKNIPIPAESTIRRYISSDAYMTEGKFNIESLKSYIEKYGLQNVPFVCAEDATRCKQGVSLKL